MELAGRKARANIGRGSKRSTGVRHHWFTAHECVVKMMKLARHRLPGRRRSTGGRIARDERLSSALRFIMVRWSLEAVDRPGGVDTAGKDGRLRCTGRGSLELGSPSRTGSDIGWRTMERGADITTFRSSFICQSVANLLFNPIVGLERSSKK